MKRTDRAIATTSAASVGVSCGVVDALPRTATGKLQRFKLRAAP